MHKPTSHTQAPNESLPRELAHDDGTATVMPAHLIPRLGRYGSLKKLQDYFDSQQYRGRPSWWTGKRGDGSIAPLRDRAPCIVYPLPRNAVRQVKRFMVGEGRFPTLKVERAEGEKKPKKAEKPEPPEEEGDDEAPESARGDLDVSDDGSSMLERGFAELIKKGAIKTVFGRMVERGLATGTAVLILELRRGKFQAELPHACDCWPTFRDGQPSNGVQKLTWCYRYKTQAVEGAELVEKVFWFRRDYDEARVVSYAPVEDRAGAIPEWKVSDVEEHGLGFCPVVWVRNGDPSAADMDGVSLYDQLLNEFDALNLALSQRHKGIHFFGSPQPYETGVAPDDGPDADGQRASGYSPDDGGGPHGAVATPARRQGPDQMWSYQGENVKLGVIETSGASFDANTKHVDDIRSRALEAMGVVIFAANDMLSKGIGDMNAKLLGMLYAPLLALVDDLRDQVWGPALLEVVSVCLRIIVAKGGDGIRLVYAKELTAAAKRFEQEYDDGQGGTEKVWTFPDVELVWGEYFTPGNEEMNAGADVAIKSKDGGLITKKTALGFIAPYFGIKDVERELEDVEEADEEKANKALERDVAMAEGQAKAKANAMPNAPTNAQPGPPGAAPTPGAPAPKGTP